MPCGGPPATKALARADKYPTFRQLDDLITTTAWGSEAREEFFHRWQELEPSDNATIESGGSFSELAHLVWGEASENDPKIKHPLAPLISRLAVRSP